MARVVESVQLKPETAKAFDEYILAAEAAMAATATQTSGFLWSGATPERIQQVRKGAVIAEYWNQAKSKAPLAVPHGLIHDWVGAVFVPAGTIEQVLGLLQDYANHKNIYKPDVIDSAVVSRAGDRFHVYLRLLKRKIITVVLDTWHDVLYSSPGPPLREAKTGLRGDPGPRRALCISHSTRILEVEHAGTPAETRSLPDTGFGFLWRLYSYWRFEEKDGGVVIECRAISLSRDIPAALAWVINPIVQKLPKDSLINTLEATRKALSAIVTQSRGTSNISIPKT